MKQNLKFGYYYGMQAEAYSFYRIPKILFTSHHFKGLSCEAKVLYGLMLDRMSLSIKNKWFDEQSRVYIVFTIEEVKNLMGCCHQTAVTLMAELDSEKGIGLIERKRTGFGKACIIYVKNFVIQEEDVNNPSDSSKSLSESAEMEPESVNDPAGSAGKISAKHAEIPEGGRKGDHEGSCPSGNCENDMYTVDKSADDAVDAHKSKNHTFISPDFRHSKVQDLDIHTSKNQTSTGLNNRHSNVQNLDANYTDISDTEKYNTESNQSIPSSHLFIHDRRRCDSGDKMDEDEMDTRDAYEDLIIENIGFGALCSEYGTEQATEILDLIVDTVYSRKKKIIIGGEPISAEIVRSRLLKLDFSHIQYVFECLKKNTTKVRNIRQYLLTALYNAPATISHYYAAEVNHDLYGAEG